jgi:KTSC domain
MKGVSMKRVAVVSSNLKSVGYDLRKKTLEVEFRTNSVYQYAKVPTDIYCGLMSADSHGRYLDSYIKKRGFAYRCINESPNKTMKDLIDPNKVIPDDDWDEPCEPIDEHDRRYREAFDNGTLAEFTGLDTPEKIAAVLAIMSKGKLLKRKRNRATTRTKKYKT